MGPLILPSGGSVYIDANAIIYSVERVEPYRILLTPMWEEAKAGRFTLTSSELVALETLVRPLRDGNARLEKRTEGCSLRPGQRPVVSVLCLALRQADPGGYGHRFDLCQCQQDHIERPGYTLLQ